LGNSAGANLLNTGYPDRPIITGNKRRINKRRGKIDEQAVIAYVKKLYWVNMILAKSNRNPGNCVPKCQYQVLAGWLIVKIQKAIFSEFRKIQTQNKLSKE
jgi:hypothetical protein